MSCSRETACLRRLITADDLYVFAAASGNYNPMHLPGEDGDGDGVPDGLAPAMFVASLVSAVLGTLLPGPGTLYRAQSLQFHDHARAGDELESRLTVAAKHDDGSVTMAIRVTRPADGALILSGEALVSAPAAALPATTSRSPG